MSRGIYKPSFKEMNRFNRALQTGRAQTVNVWQRGERMRVRAMGHLHPDQFIPIVAPSEYVNDWELLTHEENSPVFNDYPELRKSQQRFIGNVDYKVDDLIESVNRYGVTNPVIISKIRDPHTSFDAKNKDYERDKKGNILLKPKHLLIDGHHRAYAAIKSNQLIPVWIANEEQIELR